MMLSLFAKIVKRLTISGALFIFLGQSINATSAETDKSTLSEQQLLAAIFPPSCHFSGQFQQQKRIQGLDFPLVSTGDFYYSCDFGLVWNTQAPFQDALLYANSSASYRVDAQGEIEPLAGTARYIMSNVFIRLLKGDTAYFAEEFDVTRDTTTQATRLTPIGEFMRKGLQQIVVNPLADNEQAETLHVVITDVTGQDTVIKIGDTVNYSFDSKKAAYEQCQQLYPSPLEWCRVLRSRDYYERM
ncbi:outer membrane lipoprotein carrier protein LolA [Alteromonas flava]|uniref:outer membrane lipoprotein carrier protein LolA n=1 Tax=Alteromonas flava TaxID=2048003 RepID=UPI000C289809|nr:outer membrane lipoprotein carrier protein LolA [Alteromonas flava]